MAEHPCPFCEITQDPSSSRLIASNEHAFVIADDCCAHTVAQCHSQAAHTRSISKNERFRQKAYSWFCLRVNAKMKMAIYAHFVALRETSSDVLATFTARRTERAAFYL